MNDLEILKRYFTMRKYIDSIIFFNRMKQYLSVKESQETYSIVICIQETGKEGAIKMDEKKQDNPVTNFDSPLGKKTNERPEGSDIVKKTSVGSLGTETTRGDEKSSTTESNSQNIEPKANENLGAEGTVGDEKSSTTESNSQNIESKVNENLEAKTSGAEESIPLNDSQEKSIKQPEKNVEDYILKLNELQDKIVENTSKLESLDQKISSVEAMKEQLMSQVNNALETKMSKINELFKEYIKNNSKLALIEKINENLNKYLTELEPNIKDLTEKNNALEKTNKVNSEKIKDQNNKLEVLETKKEECIKLKDQLKVANENSKILKDEKERMEEMFREFIEAMKNRLNGNKRAFDDFNRKYADLLAKIESIQEELSKLVEKFEAKDTELEDSQNNFSHEKEVNKALEKRFDLEKNKLETKYGQLEKELTTAKADFKSKETELQGKLKEKEQQMQDMEMALEGASLKIETLSKEKETLDSKMEEAKKVVSEYEGYKDLFSPFEGIYNSTISLPGLMEKFGITSERTKNDYLNLASLVISNMIAQKIFDYYSVDKKGEGLDEAAKALIAEVNKYYDKEILYVPTVGESFERENMRDIEKPRDPFKTFEEVYCPGIRQDGKTIQKAIVKGKR